MCVQGHESLCRHHALFKGHLVSDKQGIMILVRLLRVTSVSICPLFKIFDILFEISFLAFYIALYACPYLIQGSCWPLDKGFIKIHIPQSILECSQESLLVGLDDLDRRLVKVGRIFPQGLSKVLENVEQASSRHLFVSAICKLIDQFIH